MDIKTIQAFVAVVLALGGLAFAMDGRYLHVAQAAELLDQQSKNEEVGRLELELDLKQHELEFLLSLKERDEGDEKKISYLERAIDRIETRLMTIQDEE